MKRIIITALLLACATIGWTASTSYTKSFKKNFEVNSDVALETKTSFASLNITHWDQNEVQVDIEVTVNAKNESKAQELFEDIEVLIIGDEYRVKIETDREGNWSQKHNGVDIEIVITINAPENARLKIRHDFGSARIGSFGNTADIKVSFGELSIDALRHPDSKVHSEYGEANIKRFHGGKLEVEFGSLRVGKVYGNCEVDASYSSAEILGIQPGVNEVDIDNEFGSVEVTVAQGVNFHIEGNASFGDVELPPSITNRKKKSEMTSFEISGDLGDGSGSMDIHSSFGDVNVDFE